MVGYAQKGWVQMPKQPFVFEVKKRLGRDKIIKYKSMDDYRLFHTHPHNISSLGGCFHKDGLVG